MPMIVAQQLRLPRDAAGSWQMNLGVNPIRFRLAWHAIKQPRPSTVWQPHHLALAWRLAPEQILAGRAVMLYCRNPSIICR